MSKPKRRVPRQDRGERRVAEVLEAAAAVIAEVGYEAATVTIVAKRAGASIGALYQYFPNKEAIVRALRAKFGDEMEAHWKRVTSEGANLSIRQLAERVIDAMTEFMETRPAYIPMLSAPRHAAKDPAARNRLRGLFVLLFREKRPDLTKEEALLVATVAVQIVKGMNVLYAGANAAEREAIVGEYKALLTGYLKARLKS